MTTHQLIAEALNRRRRRSGATPSVKPYDRPRGMAQLDREDYKVALEEVLPESIRTTMVHANRSLGAEERVPNAGRPKSRLNRSPGSDGGLREGPATPANRAAIKAMVDAKERGTKRGADTAPLRRKVPRGRKGSKEAGKTRH